jgi:hypothetical protein
MDETLGSRIRHDHRTGECIIGDGPWWIVNRKHRHNCNKRVTGTWFCTKKNPDPYRDYKPHWLVHGCWEAWRDVNTGELVRTQCKGHRVYSYEPENHCVCDEWPPVPTCDYELADWAEPHWYSRPGPKWYRDHIWQNPERVRERDELRKAAAIYNGGDWDDEDFDFDFPNHNHRHQSKWYW